MSAAVSLSLLCIVGGQDVFLRHTSPEYLPIFMMHGVDDYAHAFNDMNLWIQERHVNTSTYPIAMYEGPGHSWIDLNTQAVKVAQYIREAAKDSNMTAYHLVCHSQGALLCRAIVQEMDDHRVHTLISMSGPQMGVYGPSYIDFLEKIPIVGKQLLNVTYENLYLLVDSPGIRDISLANMWHDPVHEAAFLTRNQFLPKYNGLIDDELGNARRKANFLRLQKAVFLVGDGQDEIEPRCSGIFGYLRQGSRTDVASMREQELYVNDTFGLRSLNEVGRLFTAVAPGVQHEDWIQSRAVFEEFVLPHLV